MTYKIEISKTKTPVIFQAMLNLLNSLKDRVYRFNYECVAPILKDEYNIILHPVEQREDNYPGCHLVEFESEKDITLFLLRWA